MSRIIKIAIGLISVSVLAAAVIPAVVPKRTRSVNLDRYLCDRCAIQREVISRWRFGIPLPGSDKITATSLSRAMAAGETAKCKHTWVRVYLDHHGIQTSAHGGVNCRLAIRFLTEDDQGVVGLIKYAREMGHRPDIVWHTLFHHLAESPRGKSNEFETWLFEENGRDSEQIAAWLRDNYESIHVDTH